jgi:hypothetical protein
MAKATTKKQTAAAFTFASTTEPPRPRTSMNDEALETAISNLPVGKEFTVPADYLEPTQVRVFVQRRQKQLAKDGKSKLVTRVNDGATTVYHVAI